MKKRAQHIIAEVPRSITKVGMTIGIDLDLLIPFFGRVQQIEVAQNPFSKNLLADP